MLADYICGLINQENNNKHNNGIMSCIVQQHRHDINCTIKPYPQFHNNAKPMEKRWTVVNDYVTEIWIHIHCASLTCSCCVSAKRLWVATAAAEIKCQQQSTKRCRRCNILADGPMQYLQTPSKIAITFLAQYCALEFTVITKSWHHIYCLYVVCICGKIHEIS